MTSSLVSDMSQQSKALAAMSQDRQEIVAKDAFQLTGRKGRFTAASVKRIAGGAYNRKASYDAKTGLQNGTKYSNIENAVYLLSAVMEIFPDHFKGMTAHDYAQILYELGLTQFAFEEKVSVWVGTDIQYGMFKGDSVTGIYNEFLKNFSAWVDELVKEYNSQI